VPPADGGLDLAKAVRIGFATNREQLTDVLRSHLDRIKGRPNERRLLTEFQLITRTNALGSLSEDLNLRERVALGR
jgi:hypothetical protein